MQTAHNIRKIIKCPKIIKHKLYQYVRENDLCYEKQLNIRDKKRNSEIYKFNIKDETISIKVVLVKDKDIKRK